MTPADKRDDARPKADVVKIQWLTTAPNPRASRGGYDQGQRGWRLHAVLADDREMFAGMGPRNALCGLRPAHGWDLDMFIDDKCKRCEAKIAAEPHAAADAAEES